MRLLIRGPWEVAEVSQMTPPLHSKKASSVSSLQSPRVELPPAPFSGSSIHGCPYGNCDGDPVGGDKRGMKENNQELLVWEKKKKEWRGRVGGRKDRKASRNRGERKSRERGREREKRVFSLGKNGNLIRSVFIVQIENQF